MRLNLGLSAMFSLFMVIGTGCGKGEFTDSTNATVEPTASPNTTAGETHIAQAGGSENSAQNNENSGDNISGSDSSSSEGASKTPSSDEQILARCIASWKNSPFTKVEFANYKKIYASVNVLGIGNNIKDTEVTKSPKLILVDAAVSALSSTKYVLMNPNGWYCIKVGVNVLSKINVDLQCSANIAEGKVNVNVGSSSADNVTGVGVNVFSNIKINRKKEINSDAKCE